MEEKLMTTKEYLARKEQEDIDVIFDRAIKEAKEKQLKELKEKEHKDYMYNLFTKLADYEAEVSVMEDIYKTKYESNDVTKEEIDKIKEELKLLKMKLTKVQNDLEREIFRENAITK